MAESLTTRFKNGWNAFVKRDTEELYVPDREGVSYGAGNSRPFRSTGRGGVSRDSIIVPIFNRIGIDVSAVDMRHVRVDKEKRYIEDMDTYLNDCLGMAANIDQEAAEFFRDVAMMMCEEGAVAIIPVESKGNPLYSDSFDPSSLRVGTITQWFPKHVRVNVYNDDRGEPEEITLPKRVVAIVENPLYAVMNEPNSTLQRLLNKLRLLDVVDEQSGAGKLDIIVQLPYVIKSETKREQAEQRRKDLEDQLAGSKYGIGYTDGSERITQLNRPAENNLMGQVEYLTNMLYGQLGLTPEIIAGTANEQSMINYFSRTVEPFLMAISQALTHKFLSKTARSQGQRIKYYRDPFKLMIAKEIAEITDKFTRNEVATANDIRTQALGWKPSKDPKADELRNSNISRSKDEDLCTSNVALPGGAGSALAPPISSDVDDPEADALLDAEEAEIDDSVQVLVSELEAILSELDEE